MAVVPHWQGEGSQVTVSLACVAQVPATCPPSIMLILTRKIALLLLLLSQTVLHAQGMVTEN